MKIIQVFTVILVFLVLIAPIKAQQAPVGRKWVVDAGPQLVQITSEGIHINQPDPKGLTYYGIASTHINLATGKPWKIAFDLKFGELRSAGSGICLFDGNNVIGWVGADGWYKQMGCFVGKGNEVAVPSANTDWHHFEFSSDGATVTITEDGKSVGSGSQSGTPNLIKIGDMWGSVQPAGARPTKMLDGQQTEIWVRNVNVTVVQTSLTANIKPLTNSKPQSVAPVVTILPPAPSLDANQDSKRPTLQESLETLITEIHNSAAFTSRNGGFKENYLDVHFDDHNLIYTFEEVIEPIEDNLIEFTAPLDRLDENKIEVTVNAADDFAERSYIVSAKVKGGSYAVKHKLISGGIGTLLARDAAGVVFRFAHESDAKQFAKDLRQAIHLCILDKTPSE